MMNGNENPVEFVAYLPDGTRYKGRALLPASEIFPNAETADANFWEFFNWIENLGMSEMEYEEIKSLWDLHLDCLRTCGRRKKFNPPYRWKIRQDKREHPAPMGRASYIQKAKKENRLARSAYTTRAPQKGATREVQCEHTFKITIPRCAPCGGYDKQCKHYRPKTK